MVCDLVGTHFGGASSASPAGRAHLSPGEVRPVGSGAAAAAATLPDLHAQPAHSGGPDSGAHLPHPDHHPHSALLLLHGGSGGGPGPQPVSQRPGAGPHRQQRGDGKALRRRTAGGVFPGMALPRPASAGTVGCRCSPSGCGTAGLQPALLCKAAPQENFSGPG